MQYKRHVIVYEEHVRDNWVFCIYKNIGGYWKRFGYYSTEGLAKQAIDLLTFSANDERKIRSG